MFKSSIKTIISGAIGNALEMYDYVIWSLFSVHLTQEFLPPNAKLSDIFFLFLITYIFRPIGSFIFGILSDQLGRKRVLTISILMMGACTSIIGLLPSYDKIGVIAIFILLSVRLIQVFSVGSEYITSISLLIESCHHSKRGYFGSWAAFGINFGILMSSLLATLVLFLIEHHIIPTWSWRIPFLLSFLTMLAGFWIRNSIPDSLEFILENSRRERKFFVDIIKEIFFEFKNKLFESFLVFILVLFGVSVTVSIFIYAPIHMTTINGLTTTQALAINSISLAFLVSLIPVFGSLSDTFGRIKILSMGILSFICLLPFYFFHITYHGFYDILFFHILISLPCACIFSITPVLITEIFPLSIRCSIISVVYSVASCFGGGLTPIIILDLVRTSKDFYYPAMMFAFIGGISLLSLFMLKVRRAVRYSKLTLILNQ